MKKLLPLFLLISFIPFFATAQQEDFEAQRAQYQGLGDPDNTAVEATDPQSSAVTGLDGGTGDDAIVEEGTNWKPATQGGSIPLGDKQTGSTPALGDKMSSTQNQETKFLQNPLKGVTSIGALVNQLVNLFTSILWIIAALALLWSGFMYIKAQGEPDKITEAHARFRNVLIGIAIIVGANTISAVIQELVNSLNK